MGAFSNFFGLQRRNPNQLWGLISNQITRNPWLSGKWTFTERPLPSSCANTFIAAPLARTHRPTHDLAEAARSYCRRAMQQESAASCAAARSVTPPGFGGPTPPSPSRLIEVDGDSIAAGEEVIDVATREKPQKEPPSHVSTETQSTNWSSSPSSHTSALPSVASTASAMRTMDQIRHRLKRPSTATIGTGTSGMSGEGGGGSFLDAPSTMSGFLRMRQSAREWRMKTWYCVLFNAHLSWYGTKKDAQVAKHQQGQVHVVRASVSLGAGKIYVYPNAFTFTASNGHEYFCSAPTPEDQRQWIESINGAFQQTNARLASIESTLIENQEHNQLSIGQTSTHSASSSDSSQVMALECLVKEIEESCRSNTNSSKSNSLSLQGSLRRAPSSIRWTGRLEFVENKKPTDLACFACEIEFSALRRRRYICGSCGMGFCRWHCSKDVILSSGPAATMGTRSTRVCDACAHRQHFISFVIALTSAMVSQLKSTKFKFAMAYSHDCFNVGKPERFSTSDLSSIASCEGRFSAPRCHRRQWKELQLLISQPASFTALNLMCFLRKYQRMPWLFARTICLFIPIFETDPEALAEYWVQFVGMFVPLIQSVYPDQEYYPEMMPPESATAANSNDEYVHVNSDEQLSSLHLYMDITLAICRRSSSFALRTVWECLALFEDARLRGNVVCANYIMLLIYLVSAFDGDSELVANIWLKDAPEAQADAVVCAMDDFLHMTDLTANAAPLTPTMQWIHAKRESDMWTWRQRILAVMSCSSSSEEDETTDPENLPAKRILGIFSPMAAEGATFFNYVVNATENAQQVADQRLLDDSLISKEQLFNTEANFVHNLTAIAERLRHVTPISSRSKVLPGLSRRLQQTLSSSSTPGNGLQYLPLHGAGGSSSASCTPKILRVVTDEGKVFSTRCRAPTMLVFEALMPEPEEQATSAEVEYSFPQFQGDIKSTSSKASHAKPPSLRKLGRQESEMLDKLLCSYEKEELKELVKSSDVRLFMPPEVSDELENEPPPEELSMEDARLVYEESTSASMIESEPSKKSVETWAEKSQRVKEASEYGHLPGWTLVSIIAKSFDDLRQEVFALQLMSTLQSIFEGNDLGQLYLRPYK